ncbi:MAG: hypoxanthine phosphoribosyltransferase [Oligoflexia bacterium]|nr:hypoxanthine phosphoribosyltransferase [Oligoflexia bacterium]
MNEQITQSIDDKIKVLISEKEIEKKIVRLAKEINENYKESLPVIVCVLKGAFIFCSNLVKKLKLPLLEIEFISVSSYGNEFKSSGEVNLTVPLSGAITNKDVLLVEDIVDTGVTAKFLIEYLQKQNPKSIKLASLLCKPQKLQHKINIDYLAFNIEDKFVIGYGLDYLGKYRTLPYIGYIEE